MFQVHHCIQGSSEAATPSLPRQKVLTTKFETPVAKLEGTETRPIDSVNANIASLLQDLLRECKDIE